MNSADRLLPCMLASRATLAVVQLLSVHNEVVSLDLNHALDEEFFSGTSRLAAFPLAVQTVRPRVKL